MIDMKNKLWIAFVLLAGFSYAQEYDINTESAKVKFEYVDDETKGTITGVSAKIIVSTDSLISTTIEGTADVNTLSTANNGRDNHLKSDDFFDVKKHPTMTFTCSNFYIEDEKTYAKGTLMIKGVEKEVKFRVKTDDKNIKFYLTIYASDYGIMSKKERKKTKVIIQVIVPMT